MKKELKQKILEAKRSYGWENIYLLWTVKYSYEYENGKRRTCYKHTSKRLVKKQFKLTMARLQETWTPINDGLRVTLYLDCDVMHLDTLVFSYTEKQKLAVKQF